MGHLTGHLAVVNTKALSSREFSKELFNPFNLPESDEAEHLPFHLPESISKILWMSFVHVPFHSIEAVTAPLEEQNSGV